MVAYKHIDTLLFALAERDFDVLITTNGTLMKTHLPSIARIKNLAFILSIDGDEGTHDRVRGKGTFAQIRRASLSRKPGAILVSQRTSEFTIREPAK